jgi:tRNA1Val (adenine37-N6)-methyltransferase
MKQVRDFHFKRFCVSQHKATHKVGTDGVLLGAWVHVDHLNKALDIGTGTGVIALILAQRTPGETTIHAVEIQKDDFEQAQINFSRSPWTSRIRVFHCAVQDFKPQEKYDLVVSNPPYFTNSWLPPTASRSAVRHSGLLSFEQLIIATKALLSETGIFAVILPPTEATVFQVLAKSFGLHLIRVSEFRSRANKPVERLLMEFSQRNAVPSKESLILYSDGERWSDDYWKLTSDLYLERKL